MEIRFNVTGAARKELVQAVSEATGWEPVYKGAPTFAYAVNDYIIDKNGTVTGPDSQSILDALAEKGYAAPDGGMINQLEEVGTPAQATIAQQAASDYDLVIEFPSEGFGTTEINNLEKMIASKASLLRCALGAEDLSFYETESTLRFPWFTGELTAEKVKAYTHLIAALCQAAKKQKRVTAKERTVDNEKYAFRCFLLRLGFIGEEFKPMRKILMQNLSGNGSFKGGSRKKAEESQNPADVGAALPAEEASPEPPAAVDGGNVAAGGGDVGEDAAE